MGFLDDDYNDDDSFPLIYFFAFSRNVDRFRVNIIYAGDFDDADQNQKKGRND